MNSQYASKFLGTLQSQGTLRGITDEDMALGISMLYQGITAQPSKDAQ
jgi:hypothetical protein